MAISRDTSQDCSSTSDSATTRTATYPVTATAGKLLVAVCCLGATVAQTTIPAGWTSLVAINHNSLTFSLHLVYKVSDGTETGATFSHSASASAIRIGAYQYSGVATSSPADKSASNDDGGSGQTSLATGTTATTTQADELIFTVVGWSGGVTSPSWASATTVATVSSNTFQGLMTGQRIVAATGTYSDTASWTTSRFCDALIGTFKGAAVAATKHLGTLGVG